MSADLCYTDDPDYILEKEYDGKPDIDKLHEIFVVIYKVEVPSYSKKRDEDEAQYVFFKSLEKAFKRWKLFGPRGAMLRRIITDKDELNELALQNEKTIVIPDDENITETILKPEEPKEEQKEDSKTIVV